MTGDLKISDHIKDLIHEATIVYGKKSNQAFYDAEAKVHASQFDLEHKKKEME